MGVSQNSAIDMIPVPVSNGGTGVSTLIGIPLGAGTSAFTPLTYTDTGAWTPVVVGDGSAGTATYSTQVGIYYQIGNLVTVWCEVVWTVHTGTGGLTITGFPGLYNGGANICGPCFMDQLTIGAGILWYTALLSPSANTAIYFQGTESGTSSILQMQANGTIRFSMSYSVA